MRTIVLSALLTASLLTAAPIKDRIQDHFVPAPFGTERIDGILGARMRLNLEGRLLHIDYRGLVEGFHTRPGKHPWIGEHAGKFLHAAANTWQYTHDARIKDLMDRMARELVSGQLPDGYLGTYSDDQRWTSWDVWVHKYDLIGLLAYYDATGYEPALTASRKVGDLLAATFGDEAGRRDIVKSSTHVGMAAMSVLEPMVSLYRHTGEPRYLEFCRYLVRAYDQPNGPKIITSLNATGSVFKTANAKAYEMMSNLVGLVELYRVTGEEQFLKPAVTAWQDIASKRLYATGTTSAHEHFRDDFDLPGEEKDQVGEGCATVTWLQLSWQLLRITGEPKYAQELERTTYNQLLGAQSTENGNICYFTPLNGRKQPRTDINCCQSSEPRGISMIPQLAWGSLDKGIAVNFYTPGEAAIGGTKLKVSTAFPATGNVAIRVEPGSSSRFPLLLRVPYWTSGYEATVAGQRFAGTPGEWLAINRKWRKGDTVEIRMDMTVHTLDGGSSYPGYLAVQRGPQVLAADRAWNLDLDAVTVSLNGLRLSDAKPGFKVDGTSVTLIPFADAKDYLVWLKTTTR